MKISLLVETCGRAGRVVTVDADPETSVGELVPILADACGALLAGTLAVVAERGSDRVFLDPADSVEAAGLRDGDLVRIEPPDAAAPAVETSDAAQEAGLAVAVVAGRDAGKITPLPPGATITLADPAAETGTVTVTRTDGAVVVSSDGGAVTSLDGTPVRSLTPWPLDGALLEQGTARLNLRPTSTDVPRPPGAGQFVWHRPPRVRQSAKALSATAPEVPAPPPRPSFPLAAALLPMIAGVVLWFVTDSVVFLAFTALGPLMAVWRFVEDSRRGSSGARLAQREHVGALVAFSRELDAAHEQVRRHRRSALPDLADTAERARQWRPDLWERRSDDDDFGRVRLGTADLDSALHITTVPAPLGADARLVDARDALVAHHSVDVSVPVGVDICGSLGVAGPAEATDALCRSVVLQAAALHGPADLTAAILAPQGRSHAWAWAGWLPHTIALAGDAGAEVSVATSTVAAHALAEVAAKVAAERGIAERVDARATHLLVVVDEDSPVGRETLAEVLEAAARSKRTRVSVLWSARSPDQLPACCGQVVEVAADATASLTVAASGTRTDGIAADLAAASLCTEAARAMAPLRDPEAAHRAGTVPAMVTLHDILGEVTAESVLANWDGKATELSAPVGVGAAGTVSIDVIADGPHGFVVGTTGSGKSELLLTMLATLAAKVSPEQLTFLLIDYKGGAAFAKLAGLAHVCGFVTDLEGELASRVLVSLEGELRRRMILFRRNGAADIDEMTAICPDDAPPRLLLVVDEFAALARIVPAFVDGLVDVVRRGRSLGVHLLVGSQQPDTHTAKLADNTNLRIALAVQSDTVSREVVGVPDAARLPSGRRGRALLRRGNDDVVLFQAAYSASPFVERGVDAARVSAVDRIAVVPEESVATGRTELDVLVAAVESAWARRSGATVRPVWLPPLPTTVTITGDAVCHEGAATRAVVGLCDEPQTQSQTPRIIDLDVCRHILVVGPQGSGRTTFCRTLAAALAAGAVPRAVGIYALDFGGGGLGCLDGLPHCGGVVLAGETERVDRLFAILERMVAQRRTAVAAAGSSGLAELRLRDDTPYPSVVVFLDGYTAFAAAHEDWSGGHVERLRHLIEDGPGGGVHFVVTADRVASVPGRLADGFGMHTTLGGIGSDVVAGRAVERDGPQWQVGVFGEGGATASQVAAIDALAARWSPPEGSRILECPSPLPAEVPVAALGEAVEEGLAIGLDAAGLAPATVDLAAVPLFLVAGPMRSGRSTALVTIVSAALKAHPDAEAVLLAPRATPLLDHVEWDEAARGPDACTGLAAAVAGLVTERISGDGGWDVPLIVVVDDAELLADGPVAGSVEVVARRCWDSGVMLVVGAEAHAAARAFGWLGLVRAAKSGLLLRPDPDLDGEIFRTRLPRRRGYVFPPGRGELVSGDAKRLVQVAR